jgi:drug/metabolite transporter superfamily protein YnfA
MSTQEAIIVILAVIALVFAGIETFNANGRSLTAWGVIFLAIGMIYMQIA